MELAAPPEGFFSKQKKEEAETQKQLPASETFS